MIYINACLYFSFICFCVSICVSMFVCPRSVICIRVYVSFMFFTVLLVFVWILLHVLSYRWAPFHFPFTLLLFELLNTFISYYLHLTFLLIFFFVCVLPRFLELLCVRHSTVTKSFQIFQCYFLYLLSFYSAPMLLGDVWLVHRVHIGVLMCTWNFLFLFKWNFLVEMKHLTSLPCILKYWQGKYFPSFCNYESKF